MTRRLLILLYLTVRILADGNSCSDKLCVEDTPEAIADNKSLVDFFVGAPKCCSHSTESYDPLKRICLNSSEVIDSEWKVRLGYQSTVGALICGNDRVLVDYEIVVSFTSEGKILTMIEGRNDSTYGDFVDCEMSECEGFNTTQISPSETTDYDSYPELPSNSSGYDSVGEGDPIVSFLRDGRLGIDGETYGSGAFCLDYRSEAENTLRLTARVCESADQWCRPGRTCVRKCCLDGQILLEVEVVQPGSVSKTKIKRECRPHPKGFPIIKDLGLKLPLGVYNGDVCGDRLKYALHPKLNVHDEWRLLTNGSLFLKDIPELGAVSFPHTEYCIESLHFPRKNREGIYAYLCFPKEEDKTVYRVYAVTQLTSCVFLVATLVAYAILPSLRNLHGVTLVSHASCLLVAFLLLSVVKLPLLTTNYPLTCTVLGFSIMFSILAAFSWLSVMCFDIWWTFGQGRIRARPGIRGMSSKAGGALQGNLNKFILYSIYAWMLPLTLTLLAAMADAYGEGVLPYAPPRIGKKKCWFNDDGLWAVVIHFVGPCTALLVTDMIMFALTAVRCWRVKTEIKRMQNSDKEDSVREEGITKFGKKWWKQTYKADKERFFMNLKLFAAMGVNWSLEILSSWLSRGGNPERDPFLPVAIWYLSDLVNSLHGVLVFIVFVGKKKILAQLWKKLKSLSRCCPQSIVRDNGQNSQKGNHSYNTSSLQDINASNEDRTYNFNEDNGRQMGEIRKWLINHGFHSRRKKNPRHCSNYVSKESTTTTSVSTDISRGNVSYVP